MTSPAHAFVPLALLVGGGMFTFLGLGLKATLFAIYWPLGVALWFFYIGGQILMSAVSNSNYDRDARSASKFAWIMRISYGSFLIGVVFLGHYLEVGGYLLHLYETGVTKLDL